jgi:hypothetical protein
MVAKSISCIFVGYISGPALWLLGREVELVRFPGESHELSRSGRPDRRVERLRRLMGWFQRHLGPVGAPAGEAVAAG